MSAFARAKRMVGDRWSTMVRQAADPSSRAILLTGAAGIAGRVVTALSQFAIIPILTDMLGISGYGAFAVLTGLLTWFALADFGLGSSLQNYISRARVSGQSYADALATTATFLLLTSLALFAILMIAGAWIGPALLGGFPGLSRGDMAASFIAFGIMATGTGASFIAMRVSFANHRGYMAHLIYIGTALLGLLGLVIVRAVDPSHKFVWAIAVYNLPGWLLPMGLLIRQLRSSVGPMLVWNRTMLAELWGKGRIFLLFNLLQVLVYNVDYVILSQTMPGDQVAIYAIYAKTFSLVYFVFNSMLQAYWPVTAEILHRGEMDRLKKVVGRCILLGALIVLGGTTALFLFRPLIQHLLLHNTNAVLPVALLPLFALYWLVRVWTDSFTMVILGADKVVVLCLVIPVQVVLNLILAYYGARWFGIPGLLIGSSLSFVLTVAWALPSYIRFYVRRLAKAA